MLRAASTVAALMLAMAPASGASAAEPAYRDTRLPFAERAADLVSRMTLAEKAAQLGTTNAPPIARLGVQEYAYWSEALHGVNAFWGGDFTSPTGVDMNNVRATSFPSNLAASLAWDPALLRRETDAISDEARGFLDPSLFGKAQNNLGPAPGAYGSLFFFSPTVNLLRDPRWGRTDEGFGEDPFLVGSLASAWVEGFQGHGHYLKAVTTLKHYALNNVEDDRMGISSDTDEGTIRDYYTRQFRYVIEHADATGAMSSYNSIDGSPAVSNNLTMNVLLRRTFGFDGYTTSDCGAVGTQYRNDSGGGLLATNPTTAALAISGHGWAPPGWSTNHGDLLASWTKRGSGGLAVSGRAGAEAWALRAGTALNCVGSSGQLGHPFFWDPLRPLFSDENRIDYIRAAIAAGVLSEDVIDRALVPVFTQRMRTGEFDPRDRQPYTRITKAAIESAPHRELAQQIAEESLTLLQNNGALLPVDPKNVKKVVVVGDQASKVFLGQYSGAPDEQVPLLVGIAQAVPGAHVVYDDAGSSTTATGAPSLSDSTRAAIKDADLVVVMVGTDANVMTEGLDRKTLSLPGNYGALIDQVAAIGNPRIVLVDQSAGPVDLQSARGKVAAILYSAANGQRQGTAAANVIFGKVNPSGRLSFTWYTGDNQLPPMSDYDLTPARTGGLGRTYMYFARTPAWPFGYGLSYTTFRYSSAKSKRARVAADGRIRVSFRVTNTGTRAGATVAQLYAAPPRAGSFRQRLVGYRRTRVLAPGASQPLAIDVPVAETMRAWDAGAGREAVAPGVWRLRLGASSAQISRTLHVRVTGRLSRSIATVALAPPKLTLAVGEKLDLRERNRWLDGLAPTSVESAGDTIVSAVRGDDSFADPDALKARFSSDRPAVLRVDRRGMVTALAPGVATVTVRIGHARASAPFVVR
jgi:beta-glucosidase-like glycosyl hydrolase